MMDEALPIRLATRRVQLLQKLGAGASAEVWLVRPLPEADQDPAVLADGGPWALKIGAPDKSRYLASEAERLAMALSNHLPQAIEVGRLEPSGLPRREWNNAPYVLMTRVAGVTLGKVLERLPPHPKNHPLLVSLARSVARDVGRALADLHAAGFGHGDLKPDNVLLEEQTGKDGELSFGCGVVDLGLSTERGNETVTGGTLRYLPPEVRTSQQPRGDAQARDLWALGLILHEIVGDHAPADLKLLVESLLAPTPAARPRASWVASRAGHVATPDTHVATIRRAYLQAQHAFLHHVKDGGTARFEVDGDAKTWLQAACHVLTGLHRLQQRPTRIEATYTAFDLSSQSRVHFLMRVCGNAALDFPALPMVGDGELIRRLIQAARNCAPEAFTYALLAQPSAATVELEPDQDLLSLSLQLGGDKPAISILAQCEALAHAANAPLAFVLRLSSAFKRRGELGRARAVLLNRTEEDARLALAQVLARAGANDACLKLALPLREHGAPSIRPEAAALCARVYLSQGEVNEASRLLLDAHDTPAVLEAKTSLALAQQDLSQAQNYLDLALGRPLDAEQHARLEALAAHLNHQRGNHREALRSYERAVTSASRAGALLEEATYLVGVASNALPLGRIGDALQAAERALLLFEFLHNPSAAARAALNRASALFAAGATAETKSAASDAIIRARRAKDARCEAMAHLLASFVEQGTPALDHLERCEQLLAPSQPSDQLRLAARRLILTPNDVDVPAMDLLATTLAEPETQLSWWTARARRALETSITDTVLTQPILLALHKLTSHRDPVDAVAQAFAAGAELAARRGEGDRALQFAAIARKAHQELVDGCPSDLQLSVQQLSWASWLTRYGVESPLRAEQVGEIERLVRELSDHSHLRRVLDRVLDALVRWTGVERGLLLLSAPNGKLVVRAARNLAAQDLSAEQRQLSQTLARQALETGDCVVATDASGELSSLHQSVHALRLRSVLAVPLIARGETQGVVYLDDRIRRGAFGAPELAWVRLVSTIAAVAIAEARDHARLRRAARRAQRAERRLTDHLAIKQTELVEVKLGFTGVSVTGSTFGMVGRTPAMQSLFGLIARVAPADIPVFIFGESGTGKELVARALHQQSLRASGPFVTENCSAIPANLLESILFGHKKGAFTGAIHNHTGLFELADGGTLFLDELGEMSLSMQAKLLRVLETGELRRVGGEKNIHVDVRVVGASHRNLEQMVQAGSFREDLYYRLNVITVALPPLRERVADVPDLVTYFLRKYGQVGSPRVSPQALAALQSYSWPGNVRQLENEIRRAMVLADDSIDIQHLSPTIVGTAALQVAGKGSLNLREQLDTLEARLIERALQEANGNQSRAAETLGVSRFGLQKMLKRLGLSAPK